jgi:hypothetical protein
MKYNKKEMTQIGGRAGETWFLWWIEPWTLKQARILKEHFSSYCGLS